MMLLIQDSVYTHHRRDVVSTTFVAAGIFCIVAAIVGGGLQGAGMQVRVIHSLQRQLILGVFGLILIILGIGLFPESSVFAGFRNPEEAKLHFRGEGYAELSAPEELSENQWREVRLFVSLEKRLKWDEVEEKVKKDPLKPSESTVNRESPDKPVIVNKYKKIAIFDEMSARLVTQEFKLAEGEKGWKQISLIDDSGKWSWHIQPKKEYSGATLELKVEVGFHDTSMVTLTTDVKITPLSPTPTQIPVPTPEPVPPVIHVPTPTPAPVPTLSHAPTSTPAPEPCSATITQPDDGAEVDIMNTVSGIATNLCGDGTSLYVAVQLRQEVWPQQGRLTLFEVFGTEGLRWSAIAIVGEDADAGRGFSIIVISTTSGSEIDQEIADWFEAGSPTGETPGQFPSFQMAYLIGKGIEILDSIDVSRR